MEAGAASRRYRAVRHNRLRILARSAASTRHRRRIRRAFATVHLMEPRTWPKKAFPYVIVAAGGFLIAYLAIFLFAFPAEVVPDDAVLPNVVGMNFDDASTELDKAGFHAQQGETRFHKTIRAGVVLQEDPPAGSRQKRGIDVVLAISGGQRTAEVPELGSMTEQEAKVAIENTGLILGGVMEKM